MDGQTMDVLYELVATCTILTWSTTDIDRATDRPSDPRHLLPFSTIAVWSHTANALCTTVRGYTQQSPMTAAAAKAFHLKCLCYSLGQFASHPGHAWYDTHVYTRCNCMRKGRAATAQLPWRGKIQKRWSLQLTNSWWGRRGKLVVAGCKALVRRRRTYVTSPTTSLSHSLSQLS